MGFIGLVIFYIIGLFSGFPIIPWIVTDYYIEDSSTKLTDGVILKQTDNSFVKLEIPNGFSEDNQCLDVWFTHQETNNTQLITNFSISLHTDKNEFVKPQKIYLFGNDGSRFNGLEIANFSIISNDSSFQEKYKFIRVVYNLTDKEKFSASIMANFRDDNKLHNYKKELRIEKIKERTWNEFRLH